MTRESRERWVAVVATVEWRSERHHAQRPVAIRSGAENIAVEGEVRWVEGPVSAGEPLAYVFEVEAADGRRYRITARSGHPDRVDRLVPAS